MTQRDGDGTVVCLTEDEVLAFIAGGLGPERLARIDQHVGQCNLCFEVVRGALPEHALEQTPLPFGGMAFRAGCVVAERYRIQRFVARGGMGEVYEALDLKLSERVAIKTIRHEGIDAVYALRKLFAEVQLARRIAHRNVCRIHDLHEHRDPGGDGTSTPFLTMEFVDGQRLSSFIRGTPMPLETASAIARQLLIGLAAAHEAGVLHLDFKSDNVMLRSGSDPPHAVVMDFGLARGLETQWRPHSSDLKRIVGSAAYIAPEQVECQPALGAAADIYAFGVVLFEMLTGELPFNGPSPAAMMLERLRRPPPAPSSLRPDIPPAIDAFVLACLRPEPSHRYRDAKSALAAFDRALQGTAEAAPLSNFAGPPPLLDSAGPLPLLDSADPPPLRDALRSRKARSRRLRSASALALLAVIATPLAVWSFRAEGSRTGDEAATLGLRAGPSAITDLPLPRSTNPDAVAAYSAALQSIRDGAWGPAQPHLTRAIALDGELAAAHLRLAILQNYSPFFNARHSFSNAVRARANLSERDQTLLQAYEPILYRDPPDRREHVQRLRRATERYPQDAEFFGLLSWVLTDPDEALAAARRSVELDPKYADGWQGVGDSHLKLGQVEQAREAFDRCIALSPATADCSGARGYLHGSEGRCLEMDADFRRAVAAGSNWMWQDGRTAAMFALERPHDAVLESLGLKWAHLPDGDRHVVELLDRSNLGLAEGRLDLAERQALAARALVTSDSEGDKHTNIARQLVDIYTEMGRRDEAARVAENYLKRKDAWIGSTAIDRALIVMYWALLRGGTISQERFRRERDAWIRVHAVEHNEGAALEGYALGVETAEEALEALTWFPDLHPENAFTIYSMTLTPEAFRRDGASITMLGKLYALAGRAHEAIAPLQKTVRSCYALLTPVTYHRAAYHLGLALEQTGDAAGACLAYGKVLARWGEAKPRSVTADAARARATALGCPG